MVDNALRTVGLVLTLVAGILLVVEAVRDSIRGVPRDIFAALEGPVLVLLAGMLVLVGASRAARGQLRDAGVLAIVGAVLALLVGGELAGVLGLVGGVVALVAR